MSNNGGSSKASHPGHPSNPGPSSASSPSGFAGSSGMNMGRRDFIRLSVLSFAVLPAVADGFLVPTGQAFASDTEQETRIVAVSPRQIGIYVSDQADDSNAPIEGANVVLTSRFNGKSVSGTTGDLGTVLFDIVDLAENELVDGRYCFNGTIDVTANGYREFHMALVRLQGGLAFSAPTRSLEPDRPYPSRVSFAEWDVLYLNNEFVSCSGNDTDCEIGIEIRDLTEPATLTLRERGSSKVYASTDLIPSDGVATASLNDVFLKPDEPNALPPDGEFFMQFETSDAVYEFPLALGVKQGVASEFAIEPYQDLTPCNSNIPITPNIRIPSYIPLFGNQQLNPWLPMWSVVPVIDPFGFLYISWSTPRVGYVSDAGSTDPRKWGVHPYANSSEQFSRQVSTMQDNATKALAAMSKGSLLSHAKLVKAFTLAVSLRLEAMAKWDYSTHAFSGDAGAAAILDASVLLTEQFAVGPVPFYIGFLFNVNASLAAMLGFSTPEGLDFSQYDWDYSNTGVTLTLNLSGSLTLGVGVSGLASVGARGTFVACIFFGLATLLPDPSLPLPHVKVALSGQIAVEVQFLLFRWSGVLRSWSEPGFYNNWNGDSLASGEVQAADEGTGVYKLGEGYSYEVPPGQVSETRSSWTAILNESTPVTSADMALTSEVELQALLEGPAPLYEFDAPEPAAEGEAPESALFPWSDRLVAAPWQETPLRQAAANDEEPGIESVDLESGGVWPSLSKIMVKDVFSDPRTKVVPYKEGQVELGIVFRVASATVNGEMRSRVVAQAVDRGNATTAAVMHYMTGIDGVDRDDLYDYDFDVAGNEDGTRLHVLVLSGTRPNPDDIDPYEAFENIVFSYVELHASGVDVDENYNGLSVVRSFSWQARNFFNVPGKKNVFFCPRVLYLGERYGDASLVALSWLHRYTTDDSAPLDSDDAKVTIGMAFAYGAGVALTRLERDINEIGDGTGYDLAVARSDMEGDNEHFSMLFAVRGREGTSGASARVLTTEGRTLPAVSSVAIGPTHPINCRLTSWLGHTGFLASYEKRLVHVELTRDDTMFSITQVGDGEVDVDSLGTDATGTFVFFAANKDGVAGYTMSDESDAVPDDPVDMNYIVASKLFKGRFGNPYILCHVRHSNENLACIGHRGAAVAFLSTSITDFNTSKADLWYTVVPSVCAPTLLAVATRMPLVAAGDDAHFLLTIRNDGNVHLTGATAVMYDENKWVVSSAPIFFSEETLQPSVWNPPAGFDEDSDEPVLAQPAPITKPGAPLENDAPVRLQNTLDGYELAPGRTAVYSASLAIPADWEGERTISISIENVTYINAESSLASDGNPLQIANQNDEQAAVLTVTGDAEVGPAATQDAPVTVQTKGSEADSDDQEQEPPLLGSSAQLQGSAAPPEEDSAPLGSRGVTPIGVAAAAIGVLGAGVIAYSNRRTAIEQAKSEAMQSGEASQSGEAMQSDNEAQ